MPIESFLEYIRYEKNLSTHTVLSYRNDLFQFKKFLETECDGIEMQKVTSDCIREWWLFCRKEECRLVVFAVKFLL